VKVRLLLSVGAYERYVIARYWGVTATDQKDKTRARATRAQVKTFAQAALRAAVHEQAEALRGREKATAQRLLAPREIDTLDEDLRRPDERQLNLTW
jgi:hypothetical protein